MKGKISRVTIKFSGEMISGTDGVFDFGVINKICRNIKNVLDIGIKLSLVVGGGNIARGRTLKKNIRQEVADSVGMIATSINAIIISEILKTIGVDTAILSPVSMPFGIDNLNLKMIEENVDKVIIFTCGAGLPYFSTDTVAVIGAVMTKSDILLKATKTDGVYDRDPYLYDDAIHIPKLSYEEAFDKKVMDQVAFSIASSKLLPIKVFSLNEENCFIEVLKGTIKHSVIS